MDENYINSFATPEKLRSDKPFNESKADPINATRKSHKPKLQSVNALNIPSRDIDDNVRSGHNSRNNAKTTLSYLDGPIFPHGEQTNMKPKLGPPLS